MLKELHIKNFKGFKNSEKLKLKPLTLIYGPNSSGKSSIIHALMLLKQSLTTPTKSSGLVSSGDYIDLGSYLTMVNQHNTDFNIEFSIRYTPTKYDVSINHNSQSYFGTKYEREYDFVYQLFEDGSVEKGKVLNFLKEISFKVKNIQDNKNNASEDLLNLRFNSRLERDEKININAALIKVQDYRYTSDFYAKNHAEFLSKRLSFIDKSFSQVDNIFEKIRHTSFIKDQTFSTPSAVRFEIGSKKSKENSFLVFMENEAGRVVYDLSRELKDKFNSISYLGPLRSYPERIYAITEDYKKSVGKFGENVANLLCLDDHDILLKKINTTFNNFKIPYKISIRNLGNNEISGNVVSIELFDLRNSVVVAPSDVGFGIGQILPILVEGWTKKNSIICVEQPEIHLHPRLQAELAEFFVKTISENDNQWIIETHSESLMLRIQKMIRNNDLDNELISILYVDTFSNGTEVTEIRLDEKGRFKDIWPDGFFEERITELYGE